MAELIAGAIAVGHTVAIGAEHKPVPAIATELPAAFITSTKLELFVDLTYSHRHSLLAAGAFIVDFHPSQK